MQYKAPELEGRNWPAREDLKWACPFCGGTSAEKTSLGTTMSGDIAAGIMVGHTPGSVELREVKCTKCGDEFSLTIQMDGMVGIAFHDQAKWLQLKEPERLAYNAADPTDPTGWAGPR